MAKTPKEKNKIEEKLPIDAPEPSAPEKLEPIFEAKESPSKEEILQREQKELEETRESLDMERDSKGEARGMGQDSAHLESDEIVKKLLADAEQKGEKGIESALGAAQKMKDPYILDRLRDMLAEKIQKNKFGKKK